MPQYGIFAKEMCKPAGIDVTLEILSQAEYYGSGDNQPWLTRAGRDHRLGLARDGQPDDRAGLPLRCGLELAHWCDERFERLMHDFDGELDVQRRRARRRRRARSSTTRCRP